MSRTAVARNVVLGVVALLFCGCASTEKKPINMAFRVRSNVDRASVRYSPACPFQETNSYSLGKTPMIRYQPVPADGGSIRVSARGYHAWEGVLVPSTNVLVVPCRESTNQADYAAITNLVVDLKPLSASERKNLGWVDALPINGITLVPLQIGTQMIGDPFVSNLSGTFETEMMTAIESEMKSRFGNLFRGNVLNKTLLDNKALANKLEEIGKKYQDYSQLQTTPAPIIVDFPDEAKAGLSQKGDAVLLVDAKAYYLSATANAVRVGLPILMTVLSAAAGASGSNGGTYYYNVYSIAPSSDIVIAKAYLVQSRTGELLWMGHIGVPGSFKKGNFTYQAASGLVRQFPNKLVGIITEAGK